MSYVADEWRTRCDWLLQTTPLNIEQEGISADTRRGVHCLC